MLLGHEYARDRLQQQLGRLGLARTGLPGHDDTMVATAILHAGTSLVPWLWGVAHLGGMASPSGGAPTVRPPQRCAGQELHSCTMRLHANAPAPMQAYRLGTARAS
jgi:hypothetical protein